MPVTLWALIDYHTLFRAVPTPEFRYGAGARIQGLDLVFWNLKARLHVKREGTAR